MSSVCWIEINDIIYTRLGNKTEVVDGEISVRVDDAITLIVEDV